MTLVALMNVIMEGIFEGESVFLALRTNCESSNNGFVSSPRVRNKAGGVEESRSHDVCLEVLFNSTFLKFPSNDLDVSIGIVSDFDLVEAIAIPVVALSDVPLVEVEVHVVVVSKIVGGIDERSLHQQNYLLQQIIALKHIYPTSNNKNIFAYMKRMNDPLLSRILSQAAIMPTQLDLIRQLERLETLIPCNMMQDLLPAFHYTAEQLSNYLINESNIVKTQYYVDLFERCLRMLQAKEKTKPKAKNPATQNAIMNEIMAKIQECKQKVINPVKLQKKEKLKLQSSSSEQSQFDKIIKQIDKYYKEHNLDSCNTTIAKLFKYLDDFPEQNVAYTQIIRERMESIKKEYQKMIDFYKHFDDQESWIFDKQENDVRMQYRVYESEKTIAVRINAVIDMEMLPFLAIACEIDLQKEYVPFVYVSKLDQQIARNKRVGYSKTSVPIIADRQCYFYAVGYDRTKNQNCKSIFIFTESYEDNLELRQQYELQLDKDLKQSNKKEGEMVLLKVHYFCLEYIPLSPNRAKIRLVTKADFKMSYLPLFILQKAARIFTSDYFSSIVQKAKRYKNSQWEKKVQQNPNMYNFFQEKIDQFFKKNQ